MKSENNINNTHIGYPSIEQFKNVIYNIKHKTHYIGNDANGEPMFDGTKALPTIKFIGTTKLHGTNAGIAFDFVNDKVYYQSRERVICPANDNSGFATYMTSIEDKLVALAKEINQKGDFEKIVIFGEWCGGNIQKGVGISQLNKMFVIFDVFFILGDKIQGWLTIDALKKFKLPDLNVFNIYDYSTWEIDIDFKYPEISQNKLIELVQQVELECPVAKAFGKSGIGEGIVFKSVDPLYNGPDFWFKAKGEKHQSSKVKVLVPVDIEKVNNIKEFVDMVVTESRCQQSIQKLKEAGKPLTRQSLGDYIRWIVQDVIKEESDTMSKNGISPKEIGGPISNAAKEWFFKNELTF